MAATSAAPDASAKIHVAKIYCCVPSCERPRVCVCASVWNNQRICGARVCVYGTCFVRIYAHILNESYYYITLAIMHRAHMLCGAMRFRNSRIFVIIRGVVSAQCAPARLSCDGVCVYIECACVCVCDHSESARVGVLFYCFNGGTRPSAPCMHRTQ